MSLRPENLLGKPAWRSRQAWPTAALVTLAAFGVAAFAISARCPLGPGQDQHYHVMSAALSARYWSGDPSVRALYKFVNPFDANTLLYTFLFPFELIFDAVSAFKWGFCTLYFVGYPTACVVALALLRRPLWGALLAFPLAYTKSWSQGGYLPFVSSGPFFVLAVAAMHVFLNVPREASSLRRKRAVGVLASIGMVLTFAAHGHAYAWLMAVLGASTLVALGSDLLQGLPHSPVSTLRAGIAKGVGALVVALPSLVVFGIWYFRTHYGEHSAQSAGFVPSTETWQQKLTTLPSMFVHLADDADWGHAALLGGVVLFGLLVSSKSAAREVPVVELALLASIASFFVLPFNVSGQSVSLRHVDFFVWLLPLVVMRGSSPGRRLEALVLVSVIVGYSAFRMTVIARKLRELTGEYKGALELAKSCPVGAKELAYATFGTYSSAWAAPSFHQTHESLAALCKIDTPVYDPTIYPHNLLSLRYRKALPAPVTILVDDPRFYAHSGLWEAFDLVLVHNWKPTARDMSEISKVATRVGVSGTWQLWHRKTVAEAGP